MVPRWVIPFLAIASINAFINAFINASSGARHTPTATYTYSDACDDDAAPHRHAGVIPLPQRICAVPAIASSTLLGPVSM